MTEVATHGLWIPELPAATMPLALTTTFTIDAAVEKVAVVGQYWNKDHATKSISRVGFLPGNITSAGGSQMRLSLQNVDTANLFRPDGTQDQTVDFLASVPTANTWYRTNTLSATRTLAIGDWVSVVIEFNSFAGADVFNMVHLASPNLCSNWHVALLAPASWSAFASVPNVVLEADDGSFGTILGAQPMSSLSVSTNFGSGTTPDERALRFSLPFNCKVDGLWVMTATNAAGRNFDVVLYEGTTVLQTAAVDAEYVASIAGRTIRVTIPETSLTANTEYFVALKPGAGVINHCSFTVSDAAHLDCYPGGQAFHYAERTDAGAWTKTTTRRLYAGISISAVNTP